MVWVSSKPLIVTVYAPARMPVVSMLTVTFPLPSGPVTTGGCTVELWPDPVTETVTSSQVCPGTVESGSANGIGVNWPHHVVLSQDFTVIGAE